MSGIGKRLLCLAAAATLLLSMVSCQAKDKSVKIGVSFGVGAASRWDMEQQYMESRAKELGADIEVRLNRTDEPTQQQDCIEMIDSGIDVLVLTPRDVTKVGPILEYARQKKVPVISYARVVSGEKIDLFVGYDSSRIGQRMGQYLSEAVYEGDYIILRGDENDNNAKLLYDGSMRYLEPIMKDINVILDTAVAGWSPELAEELVTKAVAANGNKVDAILAPNDKLAGAAAAALAALDITAPVAITGMDAELDAARRIATGKQDMTIYMDLKELATIAIDEAVHLARGEKVNVNAEFDNGSGATIPSNLITGQLITRDNLDKLLIDSGYYTREQVYATP